MFKLIQLFHFINISWKKTRKGTVTEKNKALTYEEF